jgi:hypothetical protein
MKIEVENAQQNEQVDWTKNPQLVCCGSEIYLVHSNQSGSKSENHFTATRIDSGIISHYSNSWIKSAFKPFHGKITLSND